jgi:hypothetical protein
LDHLEQSETSASSGDKIVKALKRLFNWKGYQQGLKPWEPKVAFSSGNTGSQPREYLTKEERTKIREATSNMAPFRDTTIPPLRNEINGKHTWPTGSAHPNHALV